MAATKNICPIVRLPFMSLSQVTQLVHVNHKRLFAKHFFRRPGSCELTVGERYRKLVAGGLI
jgi:hypothetical protein